MAKCFILSPAAAAFVASCLQVGCEGAPDDAFADAHSEAAHELVAELSSWSESGLPVEVTFERVEDDAFADALDVLRAARSVGGE